MSKGFIFNHNKCVACCACSAACVLENGWTSRPRTIFTYNSEVSPYFPLINLSLACNHCGTAVCMEGCPAKSYTRDALSGAIIINDKKCIGCKYCQWNCPYDAPKYDDETKTIGKCNLCFSGLVEGRLPACTTACPTGALSFNELNGQVNENTFSEFPDKKLSPKIEFSGKQNYNLLRIIPERVAEPEIQVEIERERILSGDWSLAAFSFITTISVATIVSSFFKSIFPDKLIISILVVLAGTISLFHLGKKQRAWRAILNIKTSPLSREIVLFILFSIVSLVAVFFQIPGFLIAASITGLFLLISIDSVYIYADRRKSVLMHSGQTFLSALIIISFLSGAILPFIFIALLKLASSLYLLSVNKKAGVNFIIRFFRIALLLLSGASLISGISFSDNVIIFLFLTGEFLDRVIFYIDFEPLRISSMIKNQFNTSNNEKKRS